MKISWLTLSFLNFWGFLNMKVSSSFFDHNAHLLKESRSITVFLVFFSIFVFSHDCDRLLVFVSTFSDFTVSWLDGNIVVVFQLSSRPHPPTPSCTLCALYFCMSFPGLVSLWAELLFLLWMIYCFLDASLFFLVKFTPLWWFLPLGGLKKIFREATSPSFWLCVPYLYLYIGVILYL